MKVGFIGLGNMGSAILAAVSQVADVELLLSDHNEAAATRLQSLYGGLVLENTQIAREADVVFLGVKPHLVETVLKEVPKTSQAIFISMAAGVSLSQLSRYIPLGQLIRMMPNTPVAIGKGMTTFATGNPDLVPLFEKLMVASGKVKQVPEDKIDIATAIAGCGPAFVYEFIQALTTAGVQNGLTVKDAKDLATQTVLGSAAMVSSSDLHPAQLRDQVTSPGGSTIAGLVELEVQGFPAATIAAVNRALKRTQELGK